MKYTIFGESHGKKIGVVVEKIPAGVRLNLDKIAFEMARRAPGKSALSTARKEADEVEIVSGIFNEMTTGAPICGQITNTDTRSKDYGETRWLARPSHSDFAAYARYDGYNDFRGGGHFSGRLTAPLVFAGAIAKQVLAQHNIQVFAHVREISGVFDSTLDSINPNIADLVKLSEKEIPTLDDSKGLEMQEKILSAKSEGDSIGGIIECIVTGVPIGLGGPDLDDTLEGLISKNIFAVPAVKGIEFGSGFELARMLGSEANDLWINIDGKISSKTNHNGGINGGISNGLPLVFSVALKPTPSILKKQKTINMQTLEEKELQIVGRHDPCIVMRAVPVIEAATALALSTLFEV